jgi:molecular chaperone DnaJ
LSVDNAYAELGLAPGASEAEVKLAWRRLASRWHPDRNKSIAAIGKMQRINEALAQIREATAGSGAAATPAWPHRDADRHAQPAQARSSARGNAHTHENDRHGAHSTHGPHGPHDRAQSFDDDDEPGPPDWAQDGNHEPLDNAAGDTDEPASTTTRDRTITRKVKLTLEEAAAGCIKSLGGRFIDRCASCAGVGHRVLPGVCVGCEGKGTVSHRAWFGWYGVPTPCTACRGDGVAREDCHVCAGEGQLPVRAYRVKVRIPHGVRDGDQLHAGGRRHRAGQPSVALNLTVELLAHAQLELDADGTIRCELAVDGFLLIANRRVDVPTLSGLHKLRLNRDERVYRLAGLGYPAERRGARADQLVTVRPVFPAQFSADQEILLDQLIASSSGARR